VFRQIFKPGKNDGDGTGKNFAAKDRAVMANGKKEIG